MAVSHLSVGIYTKPSEVGLNRLSNVLAGVDVCPYTDDTRVTRRCKVVLTHSGAPVRGFGVASKRWHSPECNSAHVECSTALGVREYVIGLFADPAIHSITISSQKFEFSSNAELVDECAYLHNAPAHDVILLREDITSMAEVFAVLSQPVFNGHSTRLCAVLLHNTSRQLSQSLEFNCGSVSLAVRQTSTVISLHAAIVMAALAMLCRAPVDTPQNGDVRTDCAEK